MAVAIAEAKLVVTTPREIVREALAILRMVPTPENVPDGEFWEWAFDAEVLALLCRLREGLLADCQSDARKALRAILLGALHGPRPKHGASYFSNQSPRTYAPKPRYAVSYWKAKGLRPPPVDVFSIIETRARRYYGEPLPATRGTVWQADSRDPRSFTQLPDAGRVAWVITSPPYYGIRTYIPDQWLRYWFLGGPPEVVYTCGSQLGHASPAAFAAQLRAVWNNVADVCAADARMVIRFGGINDRKADPLTIIRASLDGTPWRVTRITPAGNAAHGKRQALQFAASTPRAMEEYDIWAAYNGPPR